MDASPIARAGRLHRWIYPGILLLALYLRASGAHRGLDAGYGYHPDEPKQVAAFSRFLRGEYIWYTDRIAYDGYPLLLNHLDEWALRAIRPARDWVYRQVRPDRPPPEPEGRELYRVARNFRVLYGVLAVALTMLAARRMGGSHAASQFAGLLLALSPVAFGVAHFATGDIGADLFGAATFALLACHARRPRAAWLVAAGAAVGWAFASKYNGIFVALATILYLALRARAARGVRRFVAEGLLSLGGFIAAAVAAAPQWLWNPRRTGYDFVRITRYIRDYAVPEEILALPAWRRALLSLRDNPPDLAAHFGIVLAVLALAGLGGAWAAWRRAARAAPRDPAAEGAAGLRLAVFAFAPLALLLSLATKYKILPIHLSFLQPGLCLAAAAALAGLWRARGRLARPAAALLGAAAVGELGAAAAHETFFWRRDDVQAAVSDLHGVFHEPSPLRAARRGVPGHSTVRNLALEGRNAAHFRNRPHTVSLPDGAWWNAAHVAPVPTVPLAEHSAWVFAHGPVFPRSDREFRVPADRAVDRHVVLNAPPAGLAFGLRGGREPARVDLVYGGVRATADLEPHQQVELSVVPRRWRTEPAALQDRDPVFLVPLTVRTTGGAVVVVVLPDPREARHFRAFGGDAAALRELAADRPPRGEMEAALVQTRFLESEPGVSVPLLRAGTREALDGVGGLPAGRYRLALDLDAGPDGARLAVSWRDRDGRAAPVAQDPSGIEVPPGLHRREWRFAKAFAPYDAEPVLELLGGSAHVRRWTLAPDAGALLDDLDALAAGGAAPAWCRRYPAAPAPAAPERAVGVRYGSDGEIEIETFALPGVLRAGEPFEAWTRVRRRGPARWSELRVLARLVNPEGRTVTTLSLPAARGAYGAAPAVPEPCAVPAEAAPGEYRVLVRAYNERTRRRLPVYTASKRRAFAGEWADLGTVRIEAPAPREPR